MWTYLLESSDCFLVEKCSPFGSQDCDYSWMESEGVTGRDPWGWQASGLLTVSFLQSGRRYPQTCSPDENASTSVLLFPVLHYMYVILQVQELMAME